jgi:hypothetical protein
MVRTRFSLRVGTQLIVGSLLISFATLAVAEDPGPQPALLAYKIAVAQPAPATPAQLPEAPGAHKFWDRKNRLLFATTVALNAADFTVTRANLSSGGRELNPFVRPFTANSGTLALNFIGETAATAGISYLLHRTGHHRLERLTPSINIATSAFAVGYGVSHR